jgi:methylated-DNA-protein-cysteine methyltransferase-like protein
MKDYTEAVARAVCSIPRGKVASYGLVAAAAGFPRAARAVASALRAGPRGVPWQRVVGSGGRILLRGEAGLEQRMRLEAEGVRFRGSTVRKEHVLRTLRAAGPRRSPAPPAGSPDPALLRQGDASARRAGAANRRS